jgi:DNA-binding MarR family transcriptional regulator
MFTQSPWQTAMNLTDLSKAMNAFASYHDDPSNVPLHHFRLFLEVEQLNERCTYRELENSLRLNNSSVSRTVNALAEEHRNGKPGLGFLTTNNDPDEGRRLVVTYTRKGYAFLDSLRKI